MSKTFAGAFSLALCFSGLAIGQEVTAEAPAPGSTEMRRVSQILGSNVQLNDGSGYGKVEDIVLGPDNRVAYLVVAHDKQYAMLPWEAGQFNPGDRVVTYGVAPSALQPVLFAPNAWPTTPAYYQRVRTVFPRSAVVAPGGAVVAPAGEKVKVRRNGTVKVKP